ncbi:GNAT family N-acetyltransferase [Bordetella avium]|uniref:Acetyltransferase n=1 Tax=Bordetella avium (strain 197N) TaxID=360910 RepID=Q2KYQ5_BORA1|nr:GNAT family N-acetyltransferase [Bordetella avium]RIQ51112.1 N-acetyltransferase [Bordetella avium]RIQ68808.1 N-acetyltransferase [Bordetella avium]CAJ49854.1 putative acetyltransferase [Bordetella avium 197N]
MSWTTIEIVTARLRPFAPSDAAEAFSCITPTLTRYMTFEPAPSAADFETVWRAWLPAIAAGTDFTFTLRSDGRFIGLAGLHRTGDPEPELGIWVRESEHRQGYGKEAVAAVAAWAGAAFAARALRYPVAEKNLPSRRIAERLGGQVFAHEQKAKYLALIYRIPVRE